MIKLVSIFVTTILLVSCVHIPKVLEGQFDEITPTQAAKSQVKTKKVRWSGLVQQVMNDEEKTCLVIINSQTDESLRPIKILPKDGGRFIACKKGFFEPKAFENRLMTITGTITAYTEKNIDELKYIYPVVTTDIIYIWENTRRIHNRYPNPHPFTPRVCRFGGRLFCY